ncbi:MAG TPA: glutamate synthase central domain-containing protein, partial [Candidatus Sulfotelmatobacter sp.]|nr:glutamate synthase central domain-containing protein [Candidatus Sulfotelmatobacter sp.]
PRFEHDACGIGFVADVHGRPSHEIVARGIEVLLNLEHRGACGCEKNTGDGAGILMQMPHAFLAEECGRTGFALPGPGRYGAGLVFLPTDEAARRPLEELVEKVAAEECVPFLGWRTVPTDNSSLGKTARAAEPSIRQAFFGRPEPIEEDLAWERKLYVLRRRIENAVRASDHPGRGIFYIPSLSHRTIVYKGMLVAPQLPAYFPDVVDPRVESALAMVHSRFSTNTFPSWARAHPYRFVCHNGEINTLRGNVNWMHARQSVLRSPLFGDNIKKLFPTIQPGGSDSAAFDNALELLVLSGRGIAHAMAMLIPEAWSRNEHMHPQKRAFYEYHASLMEPWDGPAAIAFTDGRSIGATLDRNGLRPARYLVTHDDMIVMASETGVLPVKPDEVKLKGRLQPGKMLLVDTVEGRMISDREIKQRLFSRNPYQLWIKENQITLDQLADPPREHGEDRATLLARQRVFGYTDEDLKMILGPMAAAGEEPIGSMGHDTPLACLSDKPQPLFHYFKQLFAQVTNPPIDPIREEMVMSLTSYIGTERNILDETPQHCHTLKLPHPILTNRDLEKLRRVSQGDFLATTLPTLFSVEEGAKGLRRALTQICRHASQAIQSGYTLLILSDRGLDRDYAPIPSLLALSAVHNHLVREKTRTQVALIIESGEPREVMHFALLIGYGASAVNPYLALETVGQPAWPAYIKAINKGLLKTFSKMGISTLQSYRGAQVFEAIGLNKEFADHYFTGTVSRVEGVGLDVIAEEALMRHRHAFAPITDFDTELDVGGTYQYRVRGEYHLFNPQTIAKLQHAVRQQSFQTFQEYADLI